MPATSSNTYFTKAFFADEQKLKLAEYISTLKGESESKRPFYTQAETLLNQEKYVDALTLFVKESDVLLKSGEKDFEAAFNLVIALIRSLPTEVFQSLSKQLSETLSKSDSDKAALKIQVLSNLYNSLPVNAGSTRCDVYMAMVRYAGKAHQLETVAPTLAQLEIWMKEWNIAVEKKREVYLMWSEKLAEVHDEKLSFDYLLKYLATFDPATPTSSPAKVDVTSVKPHVLKAAKSAIRNRDVLNFEDLYSSNAVQTCLKGDLMLELLKIFMEQDLKAYQEFVKRNPKFVSEQGLNNDDNVFKMRLLTLASLATQAIASSASSSDFPEIPYSTIASALSISDDEVELWVIESIRSKLLDVKMNQLKGTVLVSRATHRVFGKSQWGLLKSHLEAWNGQMTEVLGVLANAKLIAKAQVE